MAYSIGPGSSSYHVFSALQQGLMQLPKQKVTLGMAPIKLLCMMRKVQINVIIVGSEG